MSWRSLCPVPYYVIAKAPRAVGCPLLFAGAKQHALAAALRMHSSQAASPTRLYDVLGLTPSATHSQIKDSFYRLSKVYHPDVNSSKDAHTVFQELSHAYEVLGNKRNRKMYDRGLLNPTDPRSQHQASSNVEEATEETFSPKSSTFRSKRRGPIPTGRTQIYNFDEFYQQHYGEALKRSTSTREQAIAEEELKIKVESAKKMQRWYILSLCILVITLFMYKSDSEKRKETVVSTSEKSS